MLDQTNDSIHVSFSVDPRYHIPTIIPMPPTLASNAMIDMQHSLGFAEWSRLLKSQNMPIGTLSIIPNVPVRGWSKDRPNGIHVT